MLVCRVHFDRDRTAVTVPQRCLVRLGKPLLHVGAHLQAIDDDLDGMLRILRELRHGIDFVHVAVHAHANESLGAQFDHQLELLALAIDDDRREDRELRVLGECERRVDHLRDRHRRELLLGMIRTVRIADPRIKKAQVIVDFSDGADRRARVVRRGLLLDRDRRGQPFDQIDIGLFHQLKELPRICGKRLDVAPLAFGVERIERERALARSRQPGDHDQPLPRQVEIQILEIVRACAADTDRVHAFNLRPRAPRSARTERSLRSGRSKAGRLGHSDESARGEPDSILCFVISFTSRWRRFSQVQANACANTSRAPASNQRFFKLSSGEPPWHRSTRSSS